MSSMMQATTPEPAGLMSRDIAEIDWESVFAVGGEEENLALADVFPLPTALQSPVDPGMLRFFVPSVLMKSWAPVSTVQPADLPHDGPPSDLGPLAWIEHNRSQLASHGGEWLVLSCEPTVTLVGYAPSLKEGLALATRRDVENPFVARLPQADLPTLIF